MHLEKVACKVAAINIGFNVLNTNNNLAPTQFLKKIFGAVSLVESIIFL